MEVVPRLRFSLPLEAASPLEVAPPLEHARGVERVGPRVAGAAWQPWSLVVVGASAWAQGWLAVRSRAYPAVLGRLAGPRLLRQ